MKLLFDALQARNLSGTGTYVQALLKYYPPADPSVRPVAVVRPSDPVPDGWDTLVLDRKPRHRDFGRRYLNFDSLVHQIRPDVVHFPANFGTFWRLSARNRPAVVTTIHDLTFFLNRRWFPASRALAFQLLARRAAKQSDLIITDSASAADDIRNILKVAEERIRIIPLAGDLRDGIIDQDIQQAILKKYRLPDRFFLFLGTIEPRKNLPRLVRAWDTIAALVDCDLVIGGREGWKTRDTHASIRAARYSHRIHLIGYVPDAEVRPLMAAACAFVWPSLYEGFGLPPLEAMGCGTPVVTSNAGSMPEIAGDAALQVDPENEEEVSQALVRVARDAKLRAALSHGGRERANRFSWATTVRRTHEVYREALALRK